MAETVKNLSMQETWVSSLGRKDTLEKRMATHSSIFAWRIPWTEEPGGLQSKGSQRVRHDQVTNTFTFWSLSSPKLARKHLGWSGPHLEGCLPRRSLSPLVISLVSILKFEVRFANCCAPWKFVSWRCSAAYSVSPLVLQWFYQRFGEKNMVMQVMQPLSVCLSVAQT